MRIDFCHSTSFIARLVATLCLEKEGNVWLHSFDWTAWTSQPHPSQCSGFQQTMSAVVCSLRWKVEAIKLDKSLEGSGLFLLVATLDCLSWWWWWWSFSKQMTERGQCRADNTNIDFHLSAGAEQDIFTPPGLTWSWCSWWWSDNITPVGGAGGGQGPPTPSLPIPSATVCNYVRLLGLTPWFFSTRKGQLTFWIKVLLFSSTV